MRTISKLFGLTFVIAGLLAISASAAQAMPAPVANDATDTASVTAGEHTIILHRSGFQVGAPVSQITSAMQPAVDSPTDQTITSVMQPAVDSPTDQTAPLIINQPVPVSTTVSSDSGFGWGEFIVGAGLAALLLMLAGIAALRMRPRQTVRL